MGGKEGGNMSTGNMVERSSIDAQWRLLAQSKVSGDENMLVEYDALLVFSDYMGKRSERR